MADTSTPAGTWYLRANAQPLAITVTVSGAGYTGSAADGTALDSFSWDATGRLLQFRRAGAGWWQWYRVNIAEGVMAGRFSHGGSPSQPAITAYTYHVTGWNSSYLDSALVPRAWDLVVNNAFNVSLRLDRRADGALIARFKTYGGGAGEQLEEDLSGVRWDGSTLAFTRPAAPGGPQAYTGRVSGRTVSGTFSVGGSGSYPWSGTRAEVLTHGLADLTGPARDAWQSRARAQLDLLMMDGNPAPLSATTTILRSGVSPMNGSALPADRDDDPLNHPQAYRLTELSWTYSLPNPFGGAAITRGSHGYLATPYPEPAPGTQLPAVLCLNGHGGSAAQCFQPGNGFFWYGDGWARRGHVILAVDVGHRSDSPLYHDSYASPGDDYANGNGSRPSIKAPGFDTNWEENGERAWDLMRGLDYLLSLPYVDPARVSVTGLSLGGEMATVIAALEERLIMAIPAGFSPDIGVLRHMGAHPCWEWVYADIREYIDWSDVQALAAPRPLIVETGRLDTVYSNFSPPFAADKEVMRRTQNAYADVPGNLLHYLHYDVHHYHVGDYSPFRLPPAGFQNGFQSTRVTAPGGIGWQIDGSTRAETLFEVADRLLRPS